MSLLKLVVAIKVAVVIYKKWVELSGPSKSTNASYGTALACNTRCPKVYFSASVFDNYLNSVTSLHF